MMRKSVSLFLAFAMLFEITYPTQLMALTGGPSQPEVQSFEPVGTSDMVNLFTGDFNYNIPLLDIEGYPINIAYHAGVGMDDEASWVGLGWNINPGVINRNMRGLPDDFSGDAVVKELNMKPNLTYGVAVEKSREFFGLPELDVTSSSRSLSLGFNYNNYTGPTLSASVHLSFGIASVGITTNSDEGLSIQPSLSYSTRIKKGNKYDTNLGGNIGTSFNSRSGLKQLTIGASVTKSRNTSSHKKGVKATDAQKADITAHGGSFRGVSKGGSVCSASFDFGTATFTPGGGNSMKNFGISGSFTLGHTLLGYTFKKGISGFFSSQKLTHQTVTNRAFGYLYAENGQNDDNALMDFNREKDGSFTENTACLPLVNNTFDTYSVMGQGVSGSYRPFRSEVGCVSDPVTTTTNDDVSLGVELQYGALVHVGVDVAVTDVNGRAGKWKNNNNAINNLRWEPKGNGTDFENVYFKEANEKTVESDTSFYASAGYNNPYAPPVNFSNRYEPVAQTMGTIKRKKREKRTENFSFLKKSEYNDFAVQPVTNTYNGGNHHIAEITTLTADGARYVYGIAAYNTVQKEATFAVGSTNPLLVGDSLNNGGQEASKGLIGYNPTSDNTTDNLLGIDRYFSRVTTPAYAHSYLLTSVLSADYIDADDVRGPSDNDFGSYTRFVYQKKNNYKWRTPFEKNKASYSEGLKSDLQDDKGNYLYGEKELWYLDSVITKNYIAVFHTSDRTDGVGVQDENGGFDNTNSERMLKLDSISLYSKADLRLNPSTALPIKRVHFEYNYSLCKGIPNVSSGAGTTGKLTLKKIYYSYQNSNKAKSSPYKFTYDTFNPDYDLKGYDRWGNYKPNTATSLGVKGTNGSNADPAAFVAGDIPASDYPYVEQDQTTADQYTAAWSLKEIQLPSGGKIQVGYESDDYAYVQNRQAMQMFKIVNYNSASDAGDTLINMSAGGGKFYFKLAYDVNGNLITDINKYTNGIQNLYFRCLVKLRNLVGYDHLEYVSGYGEIDAANSGTTGIYGYITLKDVNLKDNGNGTNVNPVVKTAIQFTRLYMPKKAYTNDAAASFSEAAGIESGTGLGVAILNTVLNAVKNLSEAFMSQNESLFHTYNVGRYFATNKSWFKLQNPNNKKLGGGSRVKEIKLVDRWGDMLGGNQSETSNYGQQYEYTLSDGTSSGVASYEPQLGGDENPWRRPLFSHVKKLMVPDDEFYQEEPMGESFFPSPNVGYSKVTVRNLERTGVTRHATGKVVHEFYTSKDFPTITNRSNVRFERAKDPVYSLRSLLKINVRDYMTASQGFVIELNDMDGKPKSQSVYQEGQTTAISSVVYKYKSEPYLTGNKLTNECTTVEKNGTVSRKTIGQFFDMTADFREDKVTTNNIKIGLNVDNLPIAGLPVTIFSAWPGYARQKLRFQSATTTKVIQRFGILDEVIASDLGSTVATKNLAYDAETGNVLLTETTTNFNDKVYSLKYPAWWYYESLGPAYQNLGFEMNNVTFTSGIATVGGKTAYFREGDELALIGSPNKKGWVKTVTAGTIEVINKVGGVITGTYNIKVIRSGKRNTLGVDMASIITETNPLAGLKSNVYENVLQASAVEFSDKRKTQCNCLTGFSETTIVPYSVNPYILGTKGSWRPLKSYTHLTKRSHSNYNTNTNIRKDGMFTSYSPFYTWQAGNWIMDGQDWTYVAEVTEFNAVGEELENKDALGRYSSATFGYNQAMALSVAANSKYQEQGFDGFEDYHYNPCADDHFKFNTVNPDSTQSHTGKYSLKVSSGSPKVLNKQIALTCSDTTVCRLDIIVDVINEVKSEISVSYGTAPYSYSWKIISGSPTIVLIDTGLEITGTSYVIELTVTDGKRCTISETITR